MSSAPHRNRGTTAMSLPATTPTTTRGRDPRVVRTLLQVCEDVEADDVERLALFQAAIVASNLRADRNTTDDELGVLGQNSFWGPAVARRDTYTSADVFLREARRIRATAGAPQSPARLAAMVQGA